ncbi:MAG: DUF2911 domain-containing protein [Vicinamibacteria bacterium]
MKSRFTLWALVLAAPFVHAQPSRGKAEITLNRTTMSIDYGRPSLKGRDMVGNTPRGLVWRLGADEATTLTVTGPAVFGNMVIAKGSYSLFAERISEENWSLLVNSQTGQWGTEHDPKKDLMGIPLKWEKQSETTEELEIELVPESPNGDIGILIIRWGNDVLKQRFRLPKTS